MAVMAIKNAVVKIALVCLVMVLLERAMSLRYREVTVLEKSISRHSRCAATRFLLDPIFCPSNQQSSASEDARALARSAGFNGRNNVYSFCQNCRFILIDVSECS